MACLLALCPLLPTFSVYLNFLHSPSGFCSLTLNFVSHCGISSHSTPFPLVNSYPSLRSQLPQRYLWIPRPGQIPCYMHSHYEYGETSFPALVFICIIPLPPQGIGGAMSDFVSQTQGWHSINRQIMNRTILFLVDGLFLRLSLQPLWYKIGFGKS